MAVTVTYTAVAVCSTQAEVDALVERLTITDPTAIPSTYSEDGLTITIFFDPVEVPTTEVI